MMHFIGNLGYHPKVNVKHFMPSAYIFYTQFKIKDEIKAGGQRGCEKVLTYFEKLKRLNRILIYNWNHTSLEIPIGNYRTKLY